MPVSTLNDTTLTDPDSIFKFMVLLVATSDNSRLVALKLSVLTDYVMADNGKATFIDLTLRGIEHLS